MENLVESIKKRTFIAIAIETTGLNSEPQNGKVDHIIEIGAVKIRKGKIIEKFSTFVSCPIPVPKNIVDMAKITDKDLCGAPSIDIALKRLYEFGNGCAFVGHNLSWDFSFLNYYGKDINVSFDGKVYDTLRLANEILQGEIPNYKLFTLTTYFGVKQQGNRALDQAMTNAKLFLALAKHQSFLAWISSVREFD
jgi:DNA polymerase-3 subunit alpha (Gram-positive type)